MSTAMIISDKFGEVEGRVVTQYTLSNEGGMQVKIIDYGATITSIIIKDPQGKDKHVACGFDSMDGYLSEAYRNNAPYFGCTVGRYASRIKDGLFSIGDQDYKLAVNNGSNHLHGGIVGFDKMIWQAEIINKGELPTLHMKLKSEHLDEGYPGQVEVSVIFQLSNENELSIKYEGTSDRETPLSLTNHTYFNLSGFESTIHDHEVKIDATRVLDPDETNVPVGPIKSVVGTLEDLSQGQLLKDCFEELETGFEHYFLFDHPIGALTQVAEIRDTQSDSILEILTTEPGALFYTGYFTSDELRRETGQRYGKYRGMCFETSRYPNGPNIPGSPGSLTGPDKPFSSQTVFRFSTASAT